ncbi:MAG: acyl-CoA dehydrogenase [Rubrivivax sp.]
MTDLDDTESALRDSLQGWLADHLDPAMQGRADVAPPVPLWSALADELDLLGAGVPEADGGLGGGLRLQLIVVCTLGEWLAAEPYRSAAVLGLAALRGDSHAALRASLLRGRQRVAWAHHEPGARGGAQGLACRWQADGAGGRIDGRKSGVVMADGATQLLVSVRRDDGEPGVVLVDALADGLTRRPLRALDGSGTDEVAFDAVPAAPGAWLGGADLLDRLLDLDTLSACAEALGLMQHLQADTTEHLRTRRQFGQPLAAFQVLQHRLADVHVARVQAEALTWAVAAGFEGAAPRERALAVSSLALATGRACRAAAEGAIQLHGAMGVTEELLAGRLARRALQIEQLCADRTRHALRLDALLQDRS